MPLCDIHAHLVCLQNILFAGVYHQELLDRANHGDDVLDCVPFVNKCICFHGHHLLGRTSSLLRFSDLICLQVHMLLQLPGPCTGLHFCFAQSHAVSCTIPNNTDIFSDHWIY